MKIALAIAGTLAISQSVYEHAWAEIPQLFVMMLMGFALIELDRAKRRQRAIARGRR